MIEVRVSVRVRFMGSGCFVRRGVDLIWNSLTSVKIQFLNSREQDMLERRIMLMMIR